MDQHGFPVSQVQGEVWEVWSYNVTDQNEKSPLHKATWPEGVHILYDGQWQKVIASGEGASGLQNQNVHKACFLGSPRYFRKVAL